MTKYEWENELRKNIQRLPKIEQDRIFEYYSELFQDKIESGMTETKTIEEFGNPFDVAMRIVAEYEDENGKLNDLHDDEAQPFGGMNTQAVNEPFVEMQSGSGAANNMSRNASNSAPHNHRGYRPYQQDGANNRGYNGGALNHNTDKSCSGNDNRNNHHNNSNNNNRGYNSGNNNNAGSGNGGNYASYQNGSGNRTCNTGIGIGRAIASIVLWMVVVGFYIAGISTIVSGAITFAMSWTLISTSVPTFFGTIGVSFVIIGVGGVITWVAQPLTLAAKSVGGNEEKRGNAR